ncbi:MAG: hypothetical protein RJA22_2677 [Verrucomicrobiota bacterium]
MMPPEGIPPGPASVAPRGPGAGADAWFTPGRFAVVLALLVLAAFPGIALGLQTFVHRDFGLFGYPLAAYHRECFWRGELPLWNPYNNAGLPFLAQWNTLVLYPGSLLYLLGPLPWSLNLFCLVHLFWGGLGMYCLVQRWTGHRLAAAIAGTAFAFNGLALNCLMWPNNIAALGWMPWVVAEVEAGWRAGGRRLVRGALAGALQMLAGAPEIILCTWLFLGALWLGHRVRGLHPPAVLLRRGAGVVALVAGLSAAQMIPFLDLLRHSHRDASFGTGAWAMPAWGWANFLVPAFRMFRSGSGLLHQPDQFWTSSYYLPLGVTVLALWAAARLRQPRAALLSLTLLASLVLALGDSGWIYRWLREAFPAANVMRYPIKCIVPALFVLPLLASLSLSDRTAGSLPSWMGRRGPLPWLWGLAALGIGVILAWDQLAPREGSSTSLTLQSGLTRLALLGLFLLLLGRIRRGPIARPGLAALMLVFVVWFDALTHTTWQNPAASPGVFGPLPADARRLQPPPALGQGRAMMSLGTMEGFYRKNTPDPAAMVTARRVALLNNLNLLEAMPKVDGFYSLYLPGERSLHFRLYHRNGEPRAGLADLLGVRHVTGTSNILDWVERPSALPWVTTGQAPRWADRTNTLQALLADDFNPRATVYLPPDAAGVMPSQETGPVNARILSTSWMSHRITAEVAADGPAVVVFSQAHYPAWQATLNGRPTPLWPANLAFQAVIVPAGRHRVELVYRDRAFQAGCAASLLSLAVAALLWRRLR